MTTFSLPELPYAKDALAPHISENTLNFHYDKHHQTYVTNLNKLLEENPQGDVSLEELMIASHGKSEKAGVFNNAAQVWNHTFYWHSMAPNGGGEPSGDIQTVLTDAFGSFDEFKNLFKQAALTQFGSGWAWLVAKDGKLAIEKTGNADCPLTSSSTPLLTVDVWEHAYYLDYQNRRPDYVDTFLAHLVNWKFVEENLQKA